VQVVVRISFLVIMSLVFFGCTTETESPDVDSGIVCYSTIEGSYSVRVFETRDTCDTASERIDHRTRLETVIQSETEDGGYIIDLYLADLTWWDVVVTPDGEVSGSAELYSGVFVQNVTGTLTPKNVSLYLELNTINLLNGDISCTTNYDVTGYALFCRVPVPGETEEEPE